MIIVIALLLAIGYFYMTAGRRDDRAAHLVNAAADVDNGADAISEAARKAADRMQNGR